MEVSGGQATGQCPELLGEIASKIAPLCACIGCYFKQAIYVFKIWTLLEDKSGPRNRILCGPHFIEVTFYYSLLHLQYVWH